STIPARPGLTQAYTARTVAPDSASLLSAPAHHAAQRLRGLGLQAGPVRAAAAAAAGPSHDSSLTAMAARHQPPEATKIKLHKESVSISFLIEPSPF
ncbi:unnamed protein product, partial [Tilletia caries]